MSRPAILALLMLIVAAAVAVEPAAASRPNVILILADDLGYEALGCNGGTGSATPHLDKLAAEGLRFTGCQVMPKCTPTRAALMTGQSNVRNYVVFGSYPTTPISFGNLFRDAGWVTGIVGKWQFGDDLALPRTLGFSQWNLWHFGSGGNGSRYWDPQFYDDSEKLVPDLVGKYGPDVQNAWAKRFITEHKDKPFFLYYPATLTHVPFDPTPTQGREAKGSFQDCAAYLDILMGDLFAHLASEGLDRNTLILFVGDNGTGSGVVMPTKNGPVKGGKDTTKIQGTHVPFIASWPGKIAPGICDDLIDSTDFWPTLLDVIGAAQPADMPCDGISFLPRLLGGTPHPRENSYFWWEGEIWAQDQDFKLFANGQLMQLTDHGRGPGEAVVKEETDVTRAARARLQAVIDHYTALRPAPAGKATKAGAKGKSKPKTP